MSLMTRIVMNVPEIIGEELCKAQPHQAVHLSDKEAGFKKTF